MERMVKLIKKHALQEPAAAAQEELPEDALEDKDTPDDTPEGSPAEPVDLAQQEKSTHEGPGMAALELGQGRRSSIIERGTFEARSEAAHIRQRAQMQAEQMVAQAQHEAETILAEAAAHAQAVQAQGYAKGYQEGQQAGVGQLAEVVMRCSQRMQQIEADVIPQLSTLAVRMAKKVLGRELEFHPEAVVQIIKQALSDKARQRRDIVLRIHPEDLHIVRQSKAELIEVLSRTQDIGILEDPEVSRYGVVIETDAGTIDAQLETQLAVFERVLQEVHLRPIRG